MHLLRDFGNLANEEFVTNYRARFSLRSLVTMTNTKSFDNTNTMLDGFLHVLEVRRLQCLCFYDVNMFT